MIRSLAAAVVALLLLLPAGAGMAHAGPRGLRDLTAVARAEAPAGAAGVEARDDAGAMPMDTVAIGQLPPEALDTLRLILSGGPFEHPQDGRVFGNFERRLPRQSRGYYHEYTVRTPGARNRGTRRIIAGGEPRAQGEFYYTDDHYDTFRRIVRETSR